jgi:hypothetical protein
MPKIVESSKNAPTPQDIAEASDKTHWMLVFGVLLAFRIVNALTIKTFFQPDEYFQALEPAWKIAFGADSGAWITWVRQYTILSNIRILTPYRRNGVKDYAQQSIHGYLQSCTRPRMSCRLSKVPLELAEQKT